MSEMVKDAVISGCGHYRYSLGRTWFDGQSGLVNFVMLNPSTADADLDDPTIRRCIGFARSWGYAGLIVTNLFAFRATNPRVMAAQGHAAIGPDNDDAILDAAHRADAVVCAWGANDVRRRDVAVLGLIRSIGVTPTAIRLTKQGKPAHPLYLPGKLTMVAM